MTPVIELLVFVNGVLCGVLTYEFVTQRWAFRYAPEWVARRDAFALSPTLSLQATEAQTPDQHSNAVRVFFENLLPEGRALDDAAVTYKISKSNSIALLRELGHETAGALELRMPGVSAKEEAAGRRRRISREDLSTRIRERPAMPFTVWDGRVQLAIAGYQDKLAVFEDEGEWFLVEGPTLASTHLLKPEPVDRRLAGLTTNERFCMSLARAVRLPTAPTRLVHVPEPVLVIERFDRRRETDRVVRLHCIDGCQALGLPVTWKYERVFGDGRDVREIRDGASLRAFFSLLGGHAAVPAVERIGLLRWVVFQVLIGNVDAHAKNLTFFVNSDGLRLAPAYDLVCGLIYDNERVENTLAMAIGDEFVPQKVRAFDWATLASQCALPPRLVTRELATLARASLDQLDGVSATVREEGGDADTLERIGQVIRQQAALALQAAPLIPDAFADAVG